MSVRMFFKVLPLLAAIILIPSVGGAVTQTAASCQRTDVQSAVDAAVSRDTVLIPPGSCTWTSPVTWSNKDVVVQGAGQGTSGTVINASNGQAFAIFATSSAGVRVTNMQINTSAGVGDGTIKIDGANAGGVVPGRFRFDHLTINITGNSNASYAQSPRHFLVKGLVYGLVDNVTLLATTGIATVPVFIEHMANTSADVTLAGSVSASLPLDLGTDKAVYVEDSTFTTQLYSGINDSTYGGRMVLRHNRFNGAFHLQTHATRVGEYGGIKSEYYNNIHDAQNDCNYPGSANIISGTGVMFNNSLINNTCGNWMGVALAVFFQRCPGGDGCAVLGAPLNACSTSSGFDGGIESNGWPCLSQPGRGTGSIGNQPSVPLYAWNNGPELGCSNNGPCSGTFGIKTNPGCLATENNYIKNTAHSNGDMDYCVGTTSMPGSCGNHINTYSPYIYPHPLQAGSGSGSPPSAPTGLKVQ